VGQFAMAPLPIAVTALLALQLQCFPLRLDDLPRVPGVAVGGAEGLDDFGIIW